MKKILIMLMIISLTINAAPVGSRFTYQGQLQFNSVNTTGSYDFRFELWSDENLGSLLFISNRDNIFVNDGIFNVELDFGDIVFSGDERYLKIFVKEAGSPNGYNALLPRQRVNSTPYAIQADFLAANGATTGQVLKFDGNNWVAGSDLSSPWQTDANGVGYSSHVGVDGGASPAFSLAVGSPTGTHPLVASVNGLAALQVADNLGVRIGNGLVTAFPPPSSGLIVGGKTILSSEATVNSDLIVQRDAKHSRTDSYGFVKAGIEFSCGNIGTTRVSYFNNINSDEITVRNGAVFGTCVVELPFSYQDLYFQTSIVPNNSAFISGGCEKSITGGATEVVVCSLYDVTNNTPIVVANNVTLLMF